MSGNVALDVVIGLVFVYLLYSLYATVLMEIISASLALRARNLCYALRRMLMDEIKDSNEAARFMRQLWTSIIQVSGKAGNLQNDRLYRKFFNQSTVKYLSSGGLNNKPSYITPDNFSTALIEAVRIDDSELTLLGSIQKGLVNGLADGDIPAETGHHIQSLLDKANNDLSKFRILLEQWFVDTMERSTGWYKRNVQIFLAIIGLILAITFNVNTIAIVKNLAQDKDAREQLVKLATSYTSENQALPETLNAQQLTARIDSVNQVKRTLEEDIKRAQNVLGAAWKIPDTWRYPEWLYKIIYALTPRHFGGYFLTMLAISLGAPFWFDLLSKLVSIRTSTRPSEANNAAASGGGGTSNKETLNRVG